MLSQTCKAAIKAVIYLGSQFENGGKAGIREVAAHINENEHTVGKLLQRLVKEGIVNSVKGPNGGFYISAAQKELPVIRIVTAIDGSHVFDECGLGLSQCSASRPCPLHHTYKPVRDAFRRMCAGSKVKDLYGTVNNGLAYLVG